VLGEVSWNYCEGGEDNEGEAEAEEEALCEEELVVLFAERGHEEGEDYGDRTGC